MERKIGFLIRSPNDYFVYKNTYHSLRNSGTEGVDLIVKRIHGIPMVEPYADAFYEYIKNMMNARGEEFVSDPDSSWEIEGRYKIIIYNNNGIFCDTKKIRMLYSQAKENMTYGSIACGEFDLILTYGERSDVQCSRYKPTKIVGSPKYDDWFSGNIDMAEVNFYKSKLDINKKTVLYLPTWGEISDAWTYYDAINSLIGKYNIIMSCHDSLYWRESERLKTFDSNNILITNGSTSLLCLFKLADVVVGGNGGASMEALYVDKPVIFLDVEIAKHSSLTSSSSAEQICRSNFLVVDNPGNKELLHKYIERSIINPDEFKDKRYEITNKMFAYRDGKCAERAKEAILDFMGAQCQ